MKYVIMVMILSLLVAALGAVDRLDDLLRDYELNSGLLVNGNTVYLAQLQSSDAIPVAVKKLDFQSSYNQGVMDATALHSSTGWLFGGFASGFFLGLIGTGIIVLAASGSEPTFLPEQVDINGYRQGYYRKSKAKNQGTAAIGGVLGTAVIVVLILSAQ